MALPATISNSAHWSDHKNQSHGGAQPLTTNISSNDDGTFYDLGKDFDYVSRIAAYTGQAGHKLVRVRCYLQRVGNPSGNITAEARPALSSSIPDLTTLWGVSKTFPCSSIPTSGKNEVILTFATPVALPASDSTSFAILLTISVQGDASNYIKVYRTPGSATGSTHAYGAGSQVWTSTGSTAYANVVEISKSGALVVLLDKSANQNRLYSTSDNGGASWSLLSSQGCNTTAGLKSLNTQHANIHDLNTTYAGLSVGGNSLALYKATTNLTIDASSTISFTTLGTNVSGGMPVGGGRRANGNVVLITQGATETNMGSQWRRIKLAFHNGTSWSSVFDVVGSANTPDATLPGVGVHFDLRWAQVDPDGDTHIVYSRSDSSTLQYRKFKADNTFATINTLNGAVGSATANYPVGQGTFYFKTPDWYVIIPYVDNTSNTLKEARCKTTLTDTSANWTITQIVAASAEVAGSNPAVLIADNLQTGKVFCVYVVPTTKGLRVTDDGGTGAWKPVADFRGATQTVGGISAFYVEDGIALVYLEESTTPDEVRYDRL